MLIHLVFFITMNTLDTNIDRNRRDYEAGITEDIGSEEFQAKHEIKQHELEIFEI